MKEVMCTRKQVQEKVQGKATEQEECAIELEHIIKILKNLTIKKRILQDPIV